MKWPLINKNKLRIRLLQCVKNHQDTHAGTDDKPAKVRIRSILKNEFGYSENDINKAIKELINCDYLEKYRINIFVTQEGKRFLQNTARYEMQSIFTKSFNAVTTIFTPIVIFIAHLTKLI